MSTVSDDFFDLGDFLPDDLMADDTDAVYIKREVVNFRPVFSLYDGTGEKIAQFPNRESAVALAHHEGFIPHAVNYPPVFLFYQ